ncbi:uncharacterized protein LOC126589279 [Malus sylvestris]|uniref:uncharacterized protein LOC126589279 n=1 Tax=Malus sylvestris TaxID=3752 RepID=UPI0021AC706A|nr:uncharacterized protein LOC126589279 [Malus sylvestris]
MAWFGNVELRALIFNRENYEFWRIRMTTILKSYGLWELVEYGFEIPDPKSEKAVVDETKNETTDEVSFSEILMKDARALGMIQGEVSDQIFPTIVNEETSKGAWDVLKGEFRGDKQNQFNSSSTFLQNQFNMSSTIFAESVSTRPRPFL